MRRLRVSGCLAASIQLRKSLRAMGVRSFHRAFAIDAATSALRRSAGTLGSNSSPGDLGFIVSNDDGSYGNRGSAADTVTLRHVAPSLYVAVTAVQLSGESRVRYSSNAFGGRSVRRMSPVSIRTPGEKVPAL